MLSSSSLALLDRWSQQAPVRGGLPSYIGPSIRKIADPVAPAALAVELLDDALHGRARQRRRAVNDDGPAVNAAGRLTVGGRECCGELFTQISHQIASIAIPGDFTCTCGTSYRVEMRTHEDPRHG